MIVQGSLDVEQRAGDVEQLALVHRPLSAHHLHDHVALFADHATRHPETQHAERIANPVQGFHLRLEVTGIARFGAQIQIERILDAQQVFLDRGGHRAKQVPVAPSHRAFGVLHLRLRRQQRVELIDAPHFGAARAIRKLAVIARMGHVIQQILGQLTWWSGRIADFAVAREAVDLTVDAGEQQLHRHARLQATVFHRLDDCSRDPPQPSGFGAAGNPPQAIQHVHQPAQVLGRALIADPLEQRGLESKPQAQRLRAQLARGQGLDAAGSGVGQRGGEIRREQRRFAEQVLAAAGAQIVQQRQQDQRNVAMARLQALEIIRQLHHAAHQHGVALVTLPDAAVQQTLGEPLHVFRDHRRAVQLHHAQAALHLMQICHAGTHRLEIRRILDVCLQVLASLRHRCVKRLLDPAQRGELAVLVQFHAATPDARRHARPRMSRSRPKES